MKSTSIIQPSHTRLKQRKKVVSDSWAALGLGFRVSWITLNPKANTKLFGGLPGLRLRPLGIPASGLGM